MRSLVAGLGAVALSLTVAGAACAQGSALDRRVQAVADGRVEFNFPSRADACGDGMHWYRIGSDSWFGRTVESYNTDTGLSLCTNGPVRVAVTLIAREIVRIETYVGPLRRDTTAADLGAVDAREATAWLLGISRRVNGRPSREAIAPVVASRDAGATDGLATIAKDEDRARETRRSAISALQRLENGSGIGTLVSLGDGTADTWLAAEAVRVIGRSGDPRARRHLRAVVADARRSEDLRAAAVAGLGGERATGEDAALLREVFPTFESERTREALVSSIASAGGKANTAWLIALAKDTKHSGQLRRRAISLAERSGASGAELSALYDAVDDSETRTAVIAALAQEGSRPSRDKLVSIARSTEAPTIRRRAVTALERFDSPEVRDVLTNLAMPRP